VRRTWIPMLLMLAACGAKERNEPQRRGIIPMQLSQGLLAPHQGALEAVELAACERLQQLSEISSAGPHFSYLAGLELQRGVWMGAVEISESPFTQLILGEKFAAGDEEAFYERAREERAAGRIGAMKWFFVNFMRTIGALRTVQYSATNDKLAQNFPGIFGKVGKLEGSLPFRLAGRAAPLSRMEPKEVIAVLEAKIPLFPGDGSWSSFAKESRLSLGAALGGLGQGPGRERLCAQVLLHQHFAQLLRIKGHQSPAILPPLRNGRVSRVEELSRSQPEFRTVEVSGALFDLAAGRSVMLPNEEISGYDPSRRLLGVTALVPNGRVSSAAGGLSEALSLMEALAFGFELSSPASPLAQRQGYLYGDVSEEEGRALLPAEAHALSLGLLTMHFKNLAFLHIRKVNGEGSALREGEQAAGIMLASDHGLDSVEVRLSEVIRFTRVVSHLDRELSRFSGRPAAEWEVLNPVYDRKTQAAVFGRAIFSAEELEELLGPQAQAPALKDNLVALKLPLALLLSRMGTGPAGCISIMEWHSQVGQTRPLVRCSVQERAELASVFEQLARDTGSSLLQRKAEKLRQEL
jgi:hypothetical protein